MSGSSIAKRAAIGREAPTRDIASPSAEHCQGPVVSGREQLAQRDCQLPTWSGCACVQAGWHSFRFPAASLAVLASSVAGQLRRELHDRLDRSTKGATSRRQPAGASSRRAAGPDTSARTHENHRAQGHDDLYIRSLLFCTYSAAPFIQERGCHPIGGVTTHEPPLTTSRVPLGQPRPVSLHGHPRLPKDTDALLKREGKKHKASIQ